jgi:hypothetical protein
MLVELAETASDFAAPEFRDFPNVLTGLELTESGSSPLGGISSFCIDLSSVARFRNNSQFQKELRSFYETVRQVAAPDFAARVQKAMKEHT